MFDPNDAEGPGWFHLSTRKNFQARLPLPNPEVETECYVGAVSVAEEEPVQAIRKLKEGLEQCLGKQWWGPASKSYLKGLRGQLARDLLSTLGEYQNRFWDGPIRPSWLNQLPARIVPLSVV